MTSYRKFKSLVNDSFDKMGFLKKGIEISESMKRLDKLILEILEESQRRRK